MNPHAEEQIDIVRRIATRGLAYAQVNIKKEPSASTYIDLWQHILDEINLLRSYNEDT